MKLYWFIPILIVALCLIAACGRSPAEQPEQSVTYDAAEQRRIAEDNAAFLNENIKDGMRFSEIADLFEQMCDSSAQDEKVLFEAGTYSFGGEPQFLVQIARQIPDGADEFFQIRVELSFEPNNENAVIQELRWLDPNDKKAFAALRDTDAFRYANTHDALTVNVYVDET